MKTIALFVVGAFVVSGSALADQIADARKDDHPVISDSSTAVLVAVGPQRTGRLVGSSVGGRTIFGS